MDDLQNRLESTMTLHEIRQQDQGYSPNCQKPKGQTVASMVQETQRRAIAPLVESLTDWLHELRHIAAECKDDRTSLRLYEAIEQMKQQLLTEKQ